MDYEKKYNEALERAKKFEEKYGGGYGGYIFPELAESEDERIRKAIGAAICGTMAISILEANGTNLSDALSYLEKQKGFHYSPLCSTTKDKIREYIANHFIADTVVKTNMKSIVNAMEEGVRLGKEEQKPAEWSEKHIADIFEKVGLAKIVREQGNDELTNALQDAMLELSKSGNAEWSEEDEQYLLVCKNALNKYQRSDHWDATIILTWLENRLKSLRPQPKAELTLLDENIIDAAVAFVEQNNHFNFWRGIDKHTVIKALRSLKPHWKPSEEQMNSLKAAIEEAKEYPEAGANWEQLQGIFDQLKKL